MDLLIREYGPEDRGALIQCLSELKGFEHAINPLERVRGFVFEPVQYTDFILKEMHQNNGQMFLVEKDGRIIGCVAGWIFSKEGPPYTGRVSELFVLPDARTKGLGSMLIQHMEGYFRKHRCDSVSVEVFSGNDAHAFYEKIGYSDRCIDMIKML